MASADASASETNSLLPASMLRDKLCSDSNLSKRAAVLLRKECDSLGASLIEHAVRSRVQRGGPLEGADIWDAILNDPSLGWLFERCIAAGMEQRQPDAAAPIPMPPQLQPPLAEGSTVMRDSWLPPLVWRRLPPPQPGDPPMQMRAAFLGADESAAADPAAPVEMHLAFLVGGGDGFYGRGR